MMVFFDIGGVLAPDCWETLLVAPGKGLATRLGVPASMLVAAARPLWPRYAVRRSSEIDYWTELGEATGQRISIDMVREAQRDLIVPNPFSIEALEHARRTGLRIGVISDNTPFWYNQQAQLLDLERYADSELIFLSFERGVLKSSRPHSLFRVAAEAIDPASALVVEDRSKHIHEARAAGFATYYCRRHPDFEALPPQDGSPLPLDRLSDELSRLRHVHRSLSQ
jgi:FMN phosphatase YigB (HAD superfamily)